MTRREGSDRSRTVHAVGHVPENMQRNGGADAGQDVNLTGVAELLLDGRGRRRLHELAEPRAGIRETPRWQLDLEAIERPPDDFGSVTPHGATS